MSRKGGRISLLLGMVTGAVTGLLFAPEKGKKLRKDIAAERKKGGFGHKAVARDLANMAESVADLVKDVAHTDQAKQFWKKTNETVSGLSEGSVELDKWAKEAHNRIDALKKTVSKYAAEKKKYLADLEGAGKKQVKKTKSKAKKAVKKAKNTVKKAAKSVESKAQKTEKVAKAVKKSAKKVKKSTAAPKKVKKVAKAVKKAASKTEKVAKTAKKVAKTAKKTATSKKKTTSKKK